jgi:hypothetical protein
MARFTSRAPGDESVGEAGRVVRGWDYADGREAERRVQGLCNRELPGGMMGNLKQLGPTAQP